MERIIGLYSPVPRSGKTFTATVLTHSGFQPLSFAEPLKHMTVEFIMALGYSKEDAVRLTWTDKEKVLPEINLTSRYIQQTLGTEWGRTLVAEDVWVKSLCIRAKRFSRVVIDDVRFENEANAIKEMGGEMWMIKRPFVTKNFDHPSEGALDDWGGFNQKINNNGTLQEFRQKIDSLI